MESDGFSENCIDDVFGNMSQRAKLLLKKVRGGGNVSVVDYFLLMHIAENYWFGTPYQQKDHWKAAVAYSLLIDIAPYDNLKSSAYGARAIQFERIGELDRAIHDNTTSIDLLRRCGANAFKRFADIYILHRARCYEKNGDISLAIADYQEILNKYYAEYLIDHPNSNITVEQKIKELSDLRLRKENGRK